MIDRAPHCTAANDPWLREAVGAYLLGALEPAESDRVSAHLAGCASCRAEYGELAELLPLLASVTEAEAVSGPVKPEPVVLGRVLATTSQQLADAHAAAPRRRRGRSWLPAPTGLRTRVAMAAAGVVVVAGGVVAGTTMSNSGNGLPPGSWSATAVAARYPGEPPNERITATIDVTPAKDGSKLDLKMDNVPAGYRCAMIVVGVNGTHEMTGNWASNTEGSFAIPGWSSRTPDQITAIKVVELPDSDTLVTLDHPHS